MMIYQNTTNTSCVYDAFQQAGLPVNDEMLYGMTMGEVSRLLRKYGYKVYKKGHTVVIPDCTPFFVIRTPKNGQAHAEYHLNTVGVTEYPPETICAIALKKEQK
jgi:hypothetical protein